MKLTHQRLFLVVAAVGALSLTAPAGGAAPEAKARPRLAVLLVFDQLRGDYLIKWQDLLTEGGFKRLCREGAWFQNCHYPYANTVTGAGHATLGTGTSPDRHGIIENDWYDRSLGEKVYCATTPRYAQVPPSTAVAAGGTTPKKAAGSPERLLVPTLGDALKDATDGKGKVVALSFKDRGAVLPAGGSRARVPEGVYWFEGGNFVTSTFYRDQLPAWVGAFNAQRVADRWYGKPWHRLRNDPELYARRAGPDDQRGESRKPYTRTFPHVLTSTKGKPDKEYYDALYTSPFGNDLLLELARRALKAEDLGADDTPDLLVVSFSCNDTVGHCWGADSQEVLDVTLRADVLVKELLNDLDAHVGRGRYAVAVSADHGVCPLPEVSRNKGLDARRVPGDVLSKRAEDFLRKRFPGADAKARWIEATENYDVYLNRKLLAALKLPPETVEEALAGWLREQQGIQAAYTRAQLLNGLPRGDTLGQQVRRSFQPERSGDVVAVIQPYYLFSGEFGTGTTHGSPHPYDTHVPLLAYGPGIRPGLRQDRVTPEAAPVILARALGIEPPAGATAKVPAGLFP